MKTCFDCKYYGAESDVEIEGKMQKIGHCFRYPPQLNNGGSAMPPVRRDLPSCGEGRPKAKAKPRARK